MAQALSVHFDASLVSALLKDTHPDTRLRQVLLDVNSPSDSDILMAEFIVDFVKKMREFGISPHQSALTLNFFTQYIKNTSNTVLVDAVRTLNLTLPNLTCLAPNQLRFVMDHLSATYLKHYQLYKYVITTPREQDYTQLSKEILLPDECKPLSTGVDDCVWRYNERVREIGEEHERRLSELNRSDQQNDTAVFTGPEVEGDIAMEQGGYAFSADQIQPVVSAFLRRRCEGLEREVNRNLQITELNLERELSLIKAAKVKNEELAKTAAALSRSSLSPKKAKSSAGKSKK